MAPSVTLMLGDCLERMREIPDGSVDMVLCDLPYGTTACKWDSVIPFEPLWEQYRRVTKRNAAIVLTAAQPFSSALVASNPAMFRYEWIWRKNNPTNFLNCRVMPMRVHENILVFSTGKTPYSPQGTVPVSVKTGRKNKFGAGVYSPRESVKQDYIQTVGNYPKSIIEIRAEPKGTHPTQKPVALMEYLIRTYTSEGETVLDNTMGSGTTGVACVNTGRAFIGIERDEGYFAIAKRRIADAQAALQECAA